MKKAKDIIIGIGIFLLDVIMFAIGLLLLALYGAVLCGLIAIICIVLPLAAIYYSITNQATLIESLTELWNMTFDCLEESFSK